MLHRDPIGAVFRGRPDFFATSESGVADTSLRRGPPTKSKSVSLTAFPDMAGGLFPDLRPRTT
jgi:hypothetical protein